MIAPYRPRWRIGRSRSKRWWFLSALFWRLFLLLSAILWASVNYWRIRESRLWPLSSVRNLNLFGAKRKRRAQALMKKTLFVQKKRFTPFGNPRTTHQLITTLFSFTAHLRPHYFFGEHITNNFHAIWQLVTGNADRYQSIVDVAMAKLLVYLRALIHWRLGFASAAAVFQSCCAQPAW